LSIDFDRGFAQHFGYVYGIAKRDSGTG
jgi:hypothetical protein